MLASGFSTPELLEPCRVCGRVPDGVLNVPVSKIVLNEPRIRALVGQGEAASVAQHVRMGKQGQGSGGWYGEFLAKLCYAVVVID